MGLKPSNSRIWIAVLMIGAALSTGQIAFARGKHAVVRARHGSAPDRMIPRLREQIADRAGDASPSSPRYFVYLFCYQGPGNDPAFAHTFASFIKVTGPTPRCATWRTISWLPANFAEELRVHVSRPAVTGRNYTLEETLEFAHRAGSRVATWGPYEVTPALYRAAHVRIAELEAHDFQYIPNDHGKRAKALNCMHAVSDLAGKSESYGGVFNTGLGMWGIKGTKHVLEFYRRHGSAWLVDRVDPEHFDHGFGY